MNVKQMRMDLHQIPELGRCEYETKSYIMKQIQSLNCKIYEPTPTGIVAYFDAKKEKTICFRADMDGLKIEEKTNLSYSSKHSGLMHACGHDGHMAMLLGFMSWASEHLDMLNKNIVCLFQPSEEEGAGALDILTSNILDDLKVEEMYGIHIWPMLKKNFLYTKSCGMLASSSELDIEFYGRSVHAANRSNGIDALKIASEYVLQSYEAFEKIRESHLLSFGTFSSGGVRNAVADYAKLEGTMRCFEDETFSNMRTILFQQKASFEKKYGIQIQIQANDVYKSVINDSGLVEKYKDILSLHLLEYPFMQAEDFGCYTRRYKSMFMLLGAGNAHFLHTEDFNFDMDILDTGVEAYIKIATK